MNREVQDYKVYMNWVLHNEEKKLRSEGDGNLYVCVCVSVCVCVCVRALGTNYWPVE